MMPLADPSAGRRCGRSVAVASGKGGVGKTWFSITLAHALAQRGRRVLLFDGDLGLANVDIQLGLMPRRDLGDVLAGTATAAEAIEPFAAGGFDVLAGRSGSGALAELEQGLLDATLALLQAQKARYDDLVLDLGAGLESGVRRMAAWADMLLVIATDEPTSLTDAYATFKLHAADRPGGVARLVVNQVGSTAGATRTATTLQRACTTFLGRAPEMLGSVRRDPRVADAIRHQVPLLTRHPGCGAAHDVGKIAAVL